MSLTQAKTCGGIGAIISLIALFGFPMLEIAGIILILIAVKQISKELEEKRIFDKYLVSFIFGLMALAGLIISIASVIGSYGFFVGIAKNGSDGLHLIYSGNWLSLFLFAVLGIISKIYLRTSYNIITEHMNIDKFRKAGFFYVIGSIIYTIVTVFLILIIASMSKAIQAGHALFIVYLGFLISALITLVAAKIYEMMAYFSLPENRKAHS